MAFYSFDFFAFLTVLLCLFQFTGDRFRPALLLIASYLFYAYAHLPHLALLICVTLFTFTGSRILSRRRSTFALAIVIGLILLPLVSFKYYNFAAGLVSGMISANFGLLDIILPIGISFYTFQAISYVVDIYRGVNVPRTTLGSVALYLAFFPQILAGPIERANSLMPQLSSLTRTTANSAYIGLKYMLWGFFCKLVVADNLALIIDQVLVVPDQQSGGSLVVAFGLFSFQIYFDFLGYTNIAIGIARLFGVRLSLNFNSPYLATSIRDFWRRWHISLSTWFRDYVYIPLGGGSSRAARRSVQVLGVFLISGLWHGAALNFLAWGGFHGFAYLFEEQLRRRFPSKPTAPNRLKLVRRVIQTAITFTVVTIGWVLFRLQDFSSIRLVAERVFYLDREIFYSYINPVLIETHSIIVLGILTTAFALDSSRTVLRIINKVPESPREIMAELATVNWFLITLLLIGDYGNGRDFIYFRF